MKHKIALLWSWFVSTFTWILPDAPITMRFRGWLYGLAMKKRGKDFQVARGVILRGLENISIGNHVYIACNAVILSSCEINIEDEVMIAFNTVISDGNHTLHNGSYRFGKRTNSPIKIGYGTWIGANSTIVAGVNIGQACLIGANSVVTKNIEKNSFACGVPAKIINTITKDIE